jgi:ring-1,2-phenylacetyl-CoA epoxidase subunit PaaD
MTSTTAQLDDIHAVLRSIDDPEMPISIVDLGLVDDVAVEKDLARIRILPTFVGCPALDVLRDDIVRKVRDVEGVQRVEVEFVMDPPWSPDRISDAGRAQLGDFGVTVPRRGGACGHDNSAPTGTTVVELNVPEKVPCPFCGAGRTRMDSPFGPTRCRMIYYCEACGNQFEHMKRVGAQ